MDALRSVLRPWAPKAPWLVVAGGLLLALSWAADPFTTYTGGMAGIPGPVTWPAYFAAILLLAAGGTLKLLAPLGRLPRVAWGVLVAATVTGALAHLGGLGSGPPFAMSLVILVLANPMLVVALALLGAAYASRRDPAGAVPLAAALAFLVAPFLLADVGAPRTTTVPHSLEEAVPHALGGLALAAIGFRDLQRSRAKGAANRPAGIGS